MNAHAGRKNGSGKRKSFAVRDGFGIDQRAGFFRPERDLCAACGIVAAWNPLSRDAERGIAYIMLHPELAAEKYAHHLALLNEILGGAFPSLALRPMHRLGLLIEALPEFRTIDSLVVRDFYHRYTVDEHSLRAIEHLQELSAPPDQRGAISLPCGEPWIAAIC